MRRCPAGFLSRASAAARLACVSSIQLVMSTGSAPASGGCQPIRSAFRCLAHRAAPEPVRSSEISSASCVNCATGMTRLLPRVGADPGRLVRHERIGDRSRPARYRQPRVAGCVRACRTGCRCSLTCRQGATGATPPGRSSPPRGLSDEDARRPPMCTPPSRGCARQLRSAAARDGIGLLRRCQRDHERQGIPCSAPGVLPVA
jgi:hypothetical protein